MASIRKLPPLHLIAKDSNIWPDENNPGLYVHIMSGYALAYSSHVIICVKADFLEDEDVKCLDGMSIHWAQWEELTKSETCFFSSEEKFIQCEMTHKGGYSTTMELLPIGFDKLLDQIKVIRSQMKIIKENDAVTDIGLAYKYIDKVNKCFGNPPSLHFLFHAKDKGVKVVPSTHVEQFAIIMPHYDSTEDMFPLETFLEVQSLLEAYSA